MTISSEQREFIDACVYEHGGSVARAAAALGIPPNLYRRWFEDALFDAEFQRTQYIRLRTLGFDRFSLMLKVMAVINSNIADVADVESISDIADLPPDISYAIQSFKRTVDPQLGDVTIEVKHHDKLKALLKAVEKIAPDLRDDANMLGGEEDKRLEGVSLELPYEVLEERGLLPPPTQPDDSEALEAEMDDWLDG
jgi:hypothetical protein